MHFRQSTVSAIAVAVFASGSVAAPFWARNDSTQGSGYSSAPSVVAIPVPTEAPSAVATSPVATVAPSDGLSKTQQILLSDTRADAFNKVLTNDREDFVFDFNANRVASPPGDGGELVTANRKTFPALTNQGIGMAVGFLKPCGFNTPHIHNRATELLIVTKGKLVTEMVIENTVVDAENKPRNIRNTIEEYQMTVFFQGAIHSQFNPTCEDVILVAPQSNEDFGVSQVANNLFSLENETLRAVVDNAIDGAEIDKFKGAISTNVALGVEQCLQTCGITKRK
ncbi:hypothetical protein SLS62_008967 [Diatrype stigma]|uniref:Cupin type-1 domain-containing protein n=1 Tax=Diatrype stigma TaxID=117547 RepID=A0AAN9UGT2_9PEZI